MNRLLARLLEALLSGEDERAAPSPIVARRLSGTVEASLSFDINEVVRLLSLEWISMREESERANDRRSQLLSWGTTGYAAFASAVVVTTYEFHAPIASYSILTLVLPFLGSLLATLWLGESTRMGRAGRYASELERDIDALVRGHVSTKPDADLSRHLSASTRALPLLAWETTLRTKGPRQGAIRKSVERTPQMLLPYYLTGIFFASASVFPLPFAVALANSYRWNECAVIWLPVVVFVATVGYFIFLRRWAKTIE